MRRRRTDALSLLLPLLLPSTATAAVAEGPDGFLQALRPGQTWMEMSTTDHAEVLRLGEGEARSGGHKRPSILADALEAVIGAVYLDAGFAAADALVQRLFRDVDIQPQMQALGKDAKTELQEWLQGRKMRLPNYRVVATLGAAHQQTFDVECEVTELGLCERGIGGSRRAGEQAAATAMLTTLKTKAKP